METAAPERTETSNGSAGSPKRLPVRASRRPSAAKISSSSPAGNRPPAASAARQASVVTVKPGGTGSPARVISARLAPLPPSRSRRAPSPCSKSYTYWTAAPPAWSVVANAERPLVENLQDLAGRFFHSLVRHIDDRAADALEHPLGESQFLADAPGVAVPPGTGRPQLAQALPADLPQFVGLDRQAHDPPRRQPEQLLGRVDLGHQRHVRDLEVAVRQVHAD